MFSLSEIRIPASETELKKKEKKGNKIRLRSLKKLEIWKRKINAEKYYASKFAEEFERV